MLNDGSPEEGRAIRDRVLSAFRRHYQRDPDILVRAPGRVNLLGSHVDYNEGWVLPAATEQAVWLAAARWTRATVSLTALDFDDEQIDFSSTCVSGRESETAVTWSDYPRGVAWALQGAGHSIAPIEAVYAGNVPVGSGLSSSAAVEVAFLAAWNQMGQLDLDGLAIARLGQQAENGYIGLASGIMDQFAAVHGAESHLVLLDCRRLAHELISFPEQCTILVADSGIRRALAASEYNVRRSQCEEAVSILRAHLPGIRSLRDVAPEDFERLAHYLPIVLRKRAQHVVEECQRVLEGARFLREGDVESFGAQIRRSHISARDLYEVSIPELDLLAATAWQTEGCYGARLTGAGFGGCVVALVEAAAVAGVERALKQAYRTGFSRELTVFRTTPSVGVQVADV